MATKESIKTLEVEEMKDKFLIQRDVLSNYGLEKLKDLKRGGELNHGIRKCETGDGWEAKPWGLDGLYLHMDYDEDSKIGWYDIQCRFRLSGNIVVRLVKEEQKLSPDQVLYSDIIEADSEEEFLKTMQDSIDSSEILICRECLYYIIFRNVRYTITSIIDKCDPIIYFTAGWVCDLSWSKIIFIHSIAYEGRIANGAGIPCKVASCLYKGRGILIRD